LRVVFSQQTIILFYGNGNANNYLGTGFFVHNGIVSEVKRAEFISDRMSYMIVRGCWCDSVLNVHGPTEDKSEIGWLL